VGDFSHPAAAMQMNWLSNVLDAGQTFSFIDYQPRRSAAGILFAYRQRKVCQRKGNIMNKQLVEELAGQLKRRRSSLMFSGGNREIAPETVDERESEIEETAQLDRIVRVESHLEERGHKTLQDIEVALERLAVGEYGKCQSCEGEIGSARLRALPTATLCIDCAREQEKKKTSVGEAQQLTEFSQAEEES